MASHDGAAKAMSLVADGKLLDEFRAAAKEAYGWGGVQRAAEEAIKLWLNRQRRLDGPRAWLVQDPGDRYTWFIVVARSKEDAAQRIREYVSPVPDGGPRALPLQEGDLLAFHMELETVEWDAEGDPVRVPDVAGGYLITDSETLLNDVEAMILNGPRTEHHFSSHGERHSGTDERDECLECSPWREDLRMARELMQLAQNALDPEAPATGV